MVVQRGQATSRQAEEEQGAEEVGKAVFHASFADVYRIVLRPHCALLCTAFVALLCAAAVQIVIPWLIGRVLDATWAGDRGAVAENLGFIVAAACVGGVCSGVRGTSMVVLLHRGNVGLRQALFEALLAKDVAFFDGDGAVNPRPEEDNNGEERTTGAPTGNAAPSLPAQQQPKPSGCDGLSSRLSSDCGKVVDQVCTNLNIFLRSAVVALGLFVLMCVLHPLLALVAFTGVPLVVIVSKVYGNHVNSISKRVSAALAKAVAVAEESLHAPATVKAFGGERGEARRFADALAEYLGAGMEEAHAYSVYATLSPVLPQLASVAMIAYGSHLAMEGDISAGTLTSFVLYLSIIVESFKTMGTVYPAMAAACGSSDKALEFIVTAPTRSVAPMTQPQPPPQPLCSNKLKQEMRGAVELREVRFSYPSRPSAPVLRGLSFSVAPGTFVALVGPSGCGKSSALALLQRLYTQDAGLVLLDGREISTYSLSALRRAVSVVGQEPVLFRRSIHDNILFGLDDEQNQAGEGRYDRDAVVRAARLANAHTFIEALPDGYDTIVGSTTLSGGEKQRLALARALVRAPRVLLLDEATSALDTTSERIVQDAIDGLMQQKNTTVLCVAHRLSTIEHADAIVVLDQGVVVQQGTHEELLADTTGLYAQLHADQRTGGSDKEHYKTRPPAPQRTNSASALAVLAKDDNRSSPYLRERTTSESAISSTSFESGTTDNTSFAPQAYQAQSYDAWVRECALAAAEQMQQQQQQQQQKQPQPPLEMSERKSHDEDDVGLPV